MKKPHLEITQNNKSGLHGKCSSCDTYFTFGGPGLARNPGAAMRTMQRQFDKHFKQVHTRGRQPSRWRIVRGLVVLPFQEKHVSYAYTRFLRYSVGDTLCRI